MERNKESKKEAVSDVEGSLGERSTEKRGMRNQDGGKRMGRKKRCENRMKFLPGTQNC